MNMIERARELRQIIESLAVHLDDTEALESVELFPTWSSNKIYESEDRIRYEGVLYKCLQGHTAQSDWTPIEAPSLWAKILIPDPEVISEWEQPESTNPYMLGDKVRHNGKVWISTMDYNVFEPGVAGWKEVLNE